MGKTYDLVIVGTGTAAMTAAMRVRAAGWSVAVIDFRPFGGTCALRGCDPKKMLISGAEAVDFASRMRTRGVAGWVRNRPDGSVEAAFEGGRGAVEALLAFVRRGPRSARVDDVEVIEEPLAGDAFFEIRR